MAAASIQCRSDGVHLPLGHTRITVTVNGRSLYLDLKIPDIEDCAVIVAGEPWRKIDAFIGQLAQAR